MPTYRILFNDGTDYDIEAAACGPVDPETVHVEFKDAEGACVASLFLDNVRLIEKVQPTRVTYSLRDAYLGDEDAGRAFGFSEESIKRFRAARPDWLR